MFQLQSILCFRRFNCIRQLFRLHDEWTSGRVDEWAKKILFFSPSRPFSPSFPQSLFRFLRLLWLVSALLLYSLSASADKEEKWKKELEKDYQSVMHASAARQAQLQRELVQKWSDEGHIAELIALYKNDLQVAPDNPMLHYALGFAYAYKVEKGDPEAILQAESELKKAAQLQPDMALAHYSLGGIYLRQNRFDLAAESSRRCLQFSPKFISARFVLAEALRGLDKYEEALKEYEELLKSKPKWAEVHYGIALIYLSQGNLESAKAELLQSIDINSKFASAYYKLALINAKEGKQDEAVATYKTGSKYGGYDKDALYDLAEAFVESKNFAYAIEAYKKVIELDPKHANAQLQLGNIYYQIDLKEKAVEHYKLAISANPSLKTYFTSQLDQYEAGLMSQSDAQTALDKALLIDPNEASAHYFYGKLEEEKKNVEAAISHYEAAIKSNPAYKEAYLPLVEIYYSKGELSKAAEIYKNLIRIAPNMATYFYDQGLAAFQIKDYTRAQLNFQKFLKISPEVETSRQDVSTNLLEARFKLAKILEEQGKLQEALSEYELLLKLEQTEHPSYKLALLQTAKIYRGLKDQNKSIATLDRLISLDPSNSEAYYLKGTSLLEAGNSKDALQAFNQAIKFNPDHFDSHYQLGILYESSAELDKATSEYESAIRIDQSKAEPFLRLGAIYLKLGDKPKAGISYEKALSLEPNHPQPQYELALIYDEMNDKEKAIRHYALANKYDPNNYEWHFKYAKALEDKDNAKAIEEYTAAIGLNLNYAQSYYYRALLAKKVKTTGKTVFRSELIVEDLKQVVKLNPTWTEAYFNLGLLYLDMDQPENARSQFEKVLVLDKNYPDAHLQLGLIAEGKRDFKEAISHYEAELKVNPKSVKAHQQLAYLYTTFMMDFNKAAKEFEAALSLEPNHVPTLVNYANALYSMNKLGSAADKYEAALQIEPTNLTANYNLALVYEYSGKKPLAIEQWKRFLQLNPPAKWADEARRHLEKLGVKD